MPKLNQLLNLIAKDREMIRLIAFDSLVSFYFAVNASGQTQLYYYRVDLQEPILMRCFQFSVNALRVFNGELHVCGEKYAAVNLKSWECAITDFQATEHFLVDGSKVKLRSRVFADFSPESVDFVQEIEGFLYVEVKKQLLVYDLRDIETSIIAAIHEAECTIFYGNLVLAFGKSLRLIEAGAVALEIEGRFEQVLQIEDLIYANRGGVLYRLQVCYPARKLIAQKLMETRFFSNGLLYFRDYKMHFVFQIKKHTSHLPQENTNQLLFDCGFKDRKTEYQIIQQIDRSVYTIRKMMDQRYLQADGKLLNCKEIVTQANAKIEQSWDKYVHIDQQPATRDSELAALQDDVSALPFYLFDNSVRRRVTQLAKRLRRKFAEYEALTGRIGAENRQPSGQVEDIDIGKLFYSVYNSGSSPFY